MPMIVGLTEYLWKGPVDIFLSFMYSTVANIYGEIHKAVYIIICALFLVCIGGYFMNVVYYAIIEAFVVQKRHD